ncbi:kelch-like protein 8 isoform X2 [Lineus longissimus]|uniref:kelch-like protein 8 isoform X2 n=1 Tax=Lineus longissimus TaxID=88925 RepID=UPI00315DE34B
MSHTSPSEAAKANSPSNPPIPIRHESLDVSKLAELPGGLTKMPLTLSPGSEDEDAEGSCTFNALNLWKHSFQSQYEMYLGQELCDIELKVGSSYIQCHRLVLACVSRYFKVMFTSKMAESTKESITINDIDEQAMKSLIEFAYTGKITMTVNNVQPLLYASSILQMETVAYACSDFMKTHLDPSNCIGVRNFAEQHGRSELLKVADNFIFDNFTEVTKCDEFNEISEHHIETIVSSMDLNVDSEIEVYEAVMKWLNHKLPEREGLLTKLISRVKLPLIPAPYLMTRVEKDAILKKNLECRDFLDEAKYYQLALSGVLPEVMLTDRHRPRKSCAGVMFCVGGRGAEGDPFRSIECYNLRKDTWFHVAEMSTRRRHVGVVSVNGLLYAIGGHNGSNHLSCGEVFDPETNRWKFIGSMSTPRRGIALASLGGPLYAVGGLDDSVCYDIVERYDISNDSWSYVQSMNEPRGGVGVAALKGHLYAVGGNGGVTSLDTCERYDPHLNKWTVLATMNKRRAGAGVAVLNGYLYAVGVVVIIVIVPSGPQ